MPEVPVLIRPMSDAKVLEVQIVENLQREDVHPLDEANGYRTLIERAAYDVAGIAEKVGKSASYIYQRLKLAELAPDAQKVFLEDRITFAHAIQIARLQPRDQHDALSVCTNKHDPASSRELSRWIGMNLHLDLNAVPFSKKDPNLLPEAGSCGLCPKRMGNSIVMFPDEIGKSDTCTDRECFRRKMDAHIAARLAELQARGPVLQLSGDFQKPYGTKPKPGILYECDYRKVEPKACPSAHTGLIVEGHNRGQVLTVCTDRKCKLHQRYRYDNAGELARRKRQQEEEKKRQRLNGRIVKAVLEKIRWPLAVAELRLMAREFFADIWHERRKEICQRNGVEPILRKPPSVAKDYEAAMTKHIDKLDESGCCRLLVEIALSRHVEIRDAAAPLMETAKRLKVDVEGLRQQVERESAAKAPKAAKKARKPERRKS